MNRRNSFFLLLSLLLNLLTSKAFAQSTGATFGDVIRLGGSPSDVVLDEVRGNLYLLNSAANRVDIYDYLGKRLIGAISTGTLPVAAAMSMNGDFLYVSNNSSSSLSVIDLRSRALIQTVALTAKPEGVEVGNDGRVLITTEGTSSTDQINSLLIFDPSQTQRQQLTPVAFAPPPPTPAPVSPVVLPRPQTTFRGKLIRTIDGAFIIGLSTINNNASTVLFVYETASGSILRSRIVTGQSTVLSVSPDGSRFMAGFTLYDTSTLQVIAQQSTANIPFPLSATANVTFTTLQNVGGSTFSSDGETLYSAFNVAPFSQPATRAQASTLLISNSHHLRANLGIKIPESLIARMVITSDNSEAWGISESGLIHLPLARLYEYPILQPETTAVFLTVDDCHRGVARFSVPVVNLGKSKLTFSVPDATAALIAQASSGVVPSTINFIMEPGRTNVTRQPGTNLYSGAVSNAGTPVAINLASPEAINIPNTIQVFMNVRQPDQRGIIYPKATTTARAEGLQDILVDETRGLVYITNSGYNRIEVFDRARQGFVTPIEVGQLPHQMAFGPDGNTLYVANTGGESISIVDLVAGKVSGSVQFPPIPRSGASTPISPQAIANGLFGLQVIKSDGSQWKVVNGEATVRPANSVTPAQLVITGSVPKMMASQDGQSIIAVSGNGTAYLYNGLVDTFTISNRPYAQAAIQGYFGALAAAPDGSYLLENGFIMNSSLALIGGSETPTSTPAGPLSAIRNVAAVAPVDINTFVRITTPVKAAITSTPSGDARPLLEMLDFRNNSISVVGPIAENPVFSAIGTTRVNVPPRQLVVDSTGVAYAITLSGLSVVPMTPGGVSRPQLAGGTNSIVNSTDGTRIMKPGSFIVLNGTNLASPSTADQLPAPVVLGGSCVTFSDTAIPLLQTAAGQISAQVPADLPAGNYVVQVRSLATGQQSDPAVFMVQKP